MTKQEFLAMNLPYKTYFRIEYGTTNQPTGDYILDAVYSSGVIGGFNYDNNVMTDKFKPILHPLSDITKQIEHNGEVFVPIEELQKLDKGIWMNGDKFMYRLSVVKNITEYPFFIVQKLIEWKFNLMDESEIFIDVNTFSENPYK